MKMEKCFWLTVHTLAKKQKERINAKYDQTILIIAANETVLIKLTTTLCVCLFTSVFADFVLRKP